MAMELSLESCSASDLSTHLLEHRFAEDPTAGVEFLQSAWKAAIQKVNAGEGDSAIANFENTLLSDPLEISILNPRMGKVNLKLGEGFFAEKIQSNSMSQQPQQIFLQKGQVSNLIVFPKPEDCKLIISNSKSEKQRIPKAHMVLLKLKEPMKFGKKEIDQVCFQLPWDKKEGSLGPKVDKNSTYEGWSDATDAWRRILVKALKADNDEEGESTMIVSQVRPTHARPFLSYSDNSSSTTTGGMPFVKCNHGLEDGVLYPMEQGLLFFKPPLFLPRNDLDEINWGRGSSAGQSSSRYVDMVIKQKSNDDEIQFTNIQREETSVLNEYVHNVLIPAMKRDIKSSKDESSTEDETASDEDPAATEAMDDTDDDSSDDENFVDAEDDDSEEEDEDNDEYSDESDKDNDEYSDESDDESGGIPVVADDFAMELVKERGDDYSSESEDEGQRVSKRLRT